MKILVYWLQGNSQSVPNPATPDVGTVVSAPRAPLLVGSCYALTNSTACKLILAPLAFANSTACVVEWSGVESTGLDFTSLL